MPSLQTARRVANAKNNGAKTIGQIYKEQSDELMEWTWDNDIQSKVCYIYDYFHDDQPDKNVGMTYENTTKTKIDAKFIIKSYQSMDKDQVEYYLQFKPSQQTEFVEGDDLYYFETDYIKRYGSEDFVGHFVDIPDDKGIYHKWLICRKEPANQFVKYLILPCSYQLKWIEKDGQNRYKRSMWCVLRQQSSYTIGTYTDRYITHPDNQLKIWFELNSITEKFWYNDDSTKTMRLVVSAPTKHPIVWSVTKIENAQPFGVQKLTLYQSMWDEHTDKIEYDDFGNIVGMYADYYDSNIEPTDPDTPSHTPSNTYGKITASTSTIKVGGSYKTLTLKLYDDDNNEITDTAITDLTRDNFVWTCSCDGVELTNSDKVTWLSGSSINQKKIKFSDDRSYLDKILVIKCVVDGVETIEEFELIGT